jgi:hypothetical protein
MEVWVGIGGVVFTAIASRGEAAEAIVVGVELGGVGNGAAELDELGEASCEVGGAFRSG